MGRQMTGGFDFAELEHGTRFGVHRKKAKIIIVYRIKDGSNPVFWARSYS